MEILGLGFLASVTEHREAQTRFFKQVLGLTLDPIEGLDADVFRLPDGSGVAVYPGEPGDERSVGFLVSNIESALAELRTSGIEVEDVVVAGRWRYAHFRAPDGKRYELLEEQATRGSEAATGVERKQ